MSKPETVTGCSGRYSPSVPAHQTWAAASPHHHRSLPPTQAAGDPRAPKAGQAAKPRSCPFLPVRHLCCCHQMRKGK